MIPNNKNYEIILKPITLDNSNNLLSGAEAVIQHGRLWLRGEISENPSYNNSIRFVIFQYPKEGLSNSIITVGTEYNYTLRDSGNNLINTKVYFVQRQIGDNYYAVFEFFIDKSGTNKININGLSYPIIVRDYNKLRLYMKNMTNSLK